MVSSPDYQDDELRSLNQQLKAANQQLETVNRQLRTKEQDLLESRQRYKAVFNGVMESIAVFRAVDDGRDFIFENINSSAERLEGATRDDVLGKSVTEVFPRVKEFGLLKVFQQVWKGSIPQHFLEAICEGQRVSGWRENYVFRLPEGELVNVYEDVTESRRAKDRLADERNLLRLLIDSMPDYIYIKDSQSRFVIGNQAVAEGLGAAEPAGLSGRTDFDFFPQEAAAKYYSDEQHIIEKGTSLINIEEPVLGMDGREKWFLTTKVPWRDSRGNIIGIIGIGRDITGRKLNEDKLKSLNQQLSASEQQLRASNQQLAADEQQLRAANQQLEAAHQQLKANEQQLRASNQQLLATNQQLKAANQQLGESEEKFRSMFDLSPFSMVLLDLEGNIRDCNRQFVKFHAAKAGPEAQVGRNISEFFPPDQRLLLSGVIEKTIKEKKTVIGPVEYIMSREDGSTFPAEGFSVVVLDSTGSPEAVLGLANDITERKKAEQDLHEQKEILQTILDNIPVMVAFLDSNGNHKWVNQAWQKTLGWSLEEAQSRDVLKEFYPDPKCYQSVVDFINKAESNWGDFRTRRRDRTVLETTWTNVSLSDGSNIGIGLDITERKQAHDALQEAHDELEIRVEQRTEELSRAYKKLEAEIAERERKEELLRESEKFAAAGRLAARVAHEINNPLAGIKNSFLLIKDAVSTKHKYYNYVGLIEKEIERVSNIVRQMYDLYRPIPEKPRKFRFRELVEDVATLLKVSSEEQKVNIKVDIDAGIVVKLPDGLLRQVMFNLITNAMEASSPGMAVEVKAAIKHDELKVEIRDQGVGIPEEIREKIFEPFYTEKTEGTEAGLGLGLSVCRSIVDALGGRIEVKSRVGKGTVFTVYIPLKRPETEPENE